MVALCELWPDAVDNLASAVRAGMLVRTDCLRWSHAARRPFARPSLVGRGLSSQWPVRRLPGRCGSDLGTRLPTPLHCPAGHTLVPRGTLVG